MKTILTQGMIALIILACTGPAGKVGPAGKNSLVKITVEPPGNNCPNGGQKIETGIDLDDSGDLSNDEIKLTKFVCNGENSLINISSVSPGVTCQNGGIEVDTGIDNNGNGSLDLSEVNQTKFLCNGTNGLSTLTSYTNEPAGNNCSGGGFKMQSGLDLNGNQILDSNEIQFTKYICLPTDDKQIRLEVGESNVGTSSTDWYNTPYQTYRLIKFNKLNYANVDSITFVPSVYTCDASNKAYVELYNWTDQVEISGSQISSNTNDWIFIESKNLFDKLPNKEITLGIRVKSESSNFGYCASTGIRSYIFIYRH